MPRKAKDENVSPNTVHDEGGSENAPLTVDTEATTSTTDVAEQLEQPPVDQEEEGLEVVGEAFVHVTMHQPLTFQNTKGAEVVRVENLGGGYVYVVGRGQRLTYSEDQRVKDGEIKDFEGDILYFVTDAHPDLKVTLLK